MQIKFNSKSIHFSFDDEQRGFNKKCLHLWSGTTLRVGGSPIVSTVFSSAGFYHAILLHNACKGGVGSAPHKAGVIPDEADFSS